MTENQTQPPQNPQKPSFLKSLTIQLLRGIISLLETAVQKLEAPPPAVSKPSIFAVLWNSWVGVLALIRSILPASISQKIPDWGLTSIFAGILALVLWTSNTIISNQTPEIAQIPNSGESAPLTTEPSSEVPVEPEPEEYREPQLTPEQRLIASIQNDISSATSEYAEGLIQSIQANFRGSLLVVKITDEWYNLSESRQNKLAKNMRQSAKQLDFSRLEITDSRGNLLARSAVVGEDMIILNRRLNAEEV